MSMTGINGIRCLPNEVLAVILKHVELPDKRNGRLVCHRWRLILDCCSLIYNARLSNENAKYFFKSYREFKHVDVSGLRSRIPRMSSGKHEFPRIEKIELWNTNSQAVIKNFLKYGCENTRSLCIYYAFANVRRSILSATLRQTTWDILSSLTLCVCLPHYRKGKRKTKELLTQRKNHFDSASTFLKHARLPALQEFSLGLFGFHDPPPKLRSTNNYRLRVNRFFTNFYNFLGIHRETLKSLVFGSYGGVNVTQLPAPEVGLANLNLEKICFSIPFEYFNCPAMCGTQLKVFELFTTSPLNHNQTLILQRAFEANSSTLERVILDVNGEIPIRLLKSCKSLEYLNLNVFRDEDDADDLILWEEGMEFPSLKELVSKEPPIDLSPGLQRLISENQATLEKLDLWFDGSPQNLPINWNFLERCNDLRRLDLNMLDSDIEDEDDIDFTQIFGFSLPQVSQAEINISYRNPSQICTRLILALPRLEIVTFWRTFAELDGVQAMINSMQNLKKIILKNHDLDTIEELRNYAQGTIGLKLVETNIRTTLCTSTICIDRSKFVLQTQPVAN